jgi:DnaJ-class molecular chaperone
VTTDNVDSALDTATGLYGLDQEYPYLIECPTCMGTGKAYATRFSATPTTCRECMGLGEVEIE